VPYLRQLVAALPPRRLGLEPRSSPVGFVVAKVSLRQVFSAHFGFACQLSFHRQLHTHHLSSGSGTIGQLVADVPSGDSLIPPEESKKKNCILFPLKSLTFAREVYILCVLNEIHITFRLGCDLDKKEQSSQPKLIN
jgi:hypothetical protein